MRSDKIRNEHIRGNFSYNKSGAKRPRKLQKNDSSGTAIMIRMKEEHIVRRML